MKKFILPLIFFCLSVIGVSAQTFGHVNSQSILLELPEVKAADTNLEAYQQQLLKVGEDKVKAFEAEYQALVQRVNSEELSPVQIQTEEAKLASKQQEIRQYEVDMQDKILKKREALYTPIFDKVDKAIKEVGKEGNYTMIFDTSGGSILFVDDSVDVSAKVRAKLGL